MKLTIYQVDAFTSKLFGGNPAAVIPLEEWLDDELMQSIALENNLSETAFFVNENGEFRIRWFTPTAEVDLCGHATLASAYVMFNNLGFSESSIFFNSKSGKLVVKREGELISLDFPSRIPTPIETPSVLSEALGINPREVLFNKSTLAVLNSESEVRKLKPDIRKFLKLDTHGVIITALGDEVDFVSRFFAPDVGIDEDPVTGYAHTILTPYWTNVLGKNRMNALQVSKRGGELICELKDERVLILGEAKLYMKGEIYI